MNFISFGEYMNAGEFIQKTDPRTAVIHSKKANRHQQEIQPVKPTKVNSRRSPGSATRGGCPPITGGGRLAPPVGQPAYGPHMSSPPSKVDSCLP